MSKPSKIGFLFDIGLIVLVVLTRTFTASLYLQQWDSVQFALALKNYSIALHQPHPPGYPGYIALGLLARMFASNDNEAFVMVGMVSSALIAIAVHRIALKLFDNKTAMIAGFFAAINPLLWYYSCVALAYEAGVAVATLAVWAAISTRGNQRWIIPVLNGLASVIWAPAGILVAPVCVYAFLKFSRGENRSDRPVGVGPITGIIVYSVIAIITVALGYFFPIVDTGGLGAFLSEIQSESGKHVLRFSSWMTNPIDEFLATTGSIAMFFNDGLGMVRWLLLALLVPLKGEKGPDQKRVFALLPLLVAALAAFHLGSGPLEVLGIVIFFSLVPYLRPAQLDPKNKIRENLMLLWIVPGLLLFVLVYVNLIGIFIIFLPPLVLLAGWTVTRASDFMVLQTIRDNVPGSAEGSQDKSEVGNKQSLPDLRVGKFVLTVLIILIMLNDYEGLSKNESGENLLEIKIRDQYIGSIVNAIQNAGVDEERLMIVAGPGDLGSPGNYRHLQYYIPDAKSIWVKYILYYPVREDIHLWRSDRSEKGIPDEIFPVQVDDIDPPPLAASFDLDGIDGIIAFEKEKGVFEGRENIAPLFESPMDKSGEPVCYLIDTRRSSRVVFLGAEYADWIAPNGEVLSAWTGEFQGKWWIE